MARIFSPIVPPKDPRDCAPWLHRELRRISAAIVQAQQGLASISRNEVPDGSGNPLSPDLSRYFLLPGRPGGQIAAGDTAASGRLVLTSTSNSTKGKIYLGSALTNAFDETNSYLGLGTASPAAPLHIVAASNMIRNQTTGLTVTDCTAAAIGDYNITSAANGFGGTGGVSVVPGMLVTGNGITDGTTVLVFVSNGLIVLSQPTTATITAASLTFTPRATVRAVSSESGRDIDNFLEGAARWTSGIGGDAVMRLLTAYVREDSAQTTTMSFSGCTTVAGTHTVSSASFNATFPQVGSPISGTGLPANTYVVAKPTIGTITVSTTTTPMGTATLSAIPSYATFNFEVGSLVSASALGTTLRFGGPGAANTGELAQLAITSRSVYLQRNLSSGSNATLGINVNPRDYSGGQPISSVALSMIVGGGPIVLEPAAPIEMRDTSSGTSHGTVALGAKQFMLSNEAGAIHLRWMSGPVGAETTDTYQRSIVISNGRESRPVMRWVDQYLSANTVILQFGRALEWATADVSPTRTCRLEFGDSNRGILSGASGAKMTRFGICSDFVTIHSGTTITAPIGLGLLHLELTGTTGTIGQVIRASGVQTADYFQIRDSSSNVIYSITSGIKVGINVAVPTNDLSFGGETARTIWMERRTASNTAGNALTVQSGGATSGATNKAAGALNLATGISTGSGGGTINLQTATPGASGTGNNTVSTKLSLNGFGAIVHSISTYPTSAIGHQQNFIISSGINGATLLGNAWTHTYTNVVDSVIYGLQMGLSVTTDSTDAGGSAISGFSFEIFENGESGTGAPVTAIGGFARHISTATGLIFTGCNMDVQTQTGAGSCDINLYTATATILDGNVGEYRMFYAATSGTFTGTITTAYGLYITNVNFATNNYAIWAGGGQSVHAGKFSIGHTTDPAESLDLSGNIRIADGTNGTKIGTATSQKLGFWNATPIAQPTTAVAAATFTANTSAIANDTATFDGYTIGQVVKALRNAGLLA